jgi:hypothetical protein
MGRRNRLCGSRVARSRRFALLRPRIRATVGLDRAIREPLIAITTATRSSPLTTPGDGGIVEFSSTVADPATPPYRPMWSTRIGDPRPRFMFSGFAPWQTTPSHATTVAARSLTPAARCRLPGPHPRSTDIDAPTPSRRVGARNPGTTRFVMNRPSEGAPWTSLIAGMTSRNRSRLRGAASCSAMRPTR